MINLKELRYVNLSLSESEDSGVLLPSEIVRRVHGFNAENGNLLGIDFPDWTQSATAHMGTRVRLFGTESSLTLFLADVRTRRMLSCGVRISSMAAIPASAQGVTVKRDATANKMKSSQTRRLARRQAARGVSDAQSNCARSGVAVKRSVGVPLTSKSSNRGFALRIRRVSCDVATAVKFNSYGFTQAGAVPQF
jgi:CRISPR-associated endoribonuclease Cas6/Csy4 subtype I-F